MEVSRYPIGSIIPYWRNPRRISDEAVASVAESIERFGYQSPIIVDRELTVIAGHTRLQALRKLGHTEVDVIVADLDSESAKAYRLIDNRTSELGVWDDDKLFLELREMVDTGLAERFFPEVTLAVAPVEMKPITEEDLSRAAGILTGKTSSAEEPDRKQREVTCPHCYQQFFVTT